MTSLPQELADLLVNLMEANDRAVEALGQTDTFAWHRSGGMGPTHLLHAGAHDEQTVDPALMEALIDAGLLRRTGQRAAVLTAGGLSLGRELQLERSRTTALDPSWDAVSPVLQAFWMEWRDAGAPMVGVGSELVAARAGLDISVVERYLDLLEDDLWVVQRSPGTISAGGIGPSYVPAQKTMQVFGGWPLPGEMAARQLIDAVDLAIEVADNEQERSRLGALRESLVRVGESAVGQILGNLASGGG